MGSCFCKVPFLMCNQTGGCMQKNLDSFFTITKSIAPIVRSIMSAGGTAYLVGGSVRDIVLGRELKDFDIEVHGLTIEALETVLSSFGIVILVGKQFGVLRISSYDIDWSIPRKDSVGRKPTVELDPSMTIEIACRRRDVTMNAMAIDLGYIVEHYDDLYQKSMQNKLAVTTDFCIVDPYNGLDALAKKQLRAVDKILFLEDPLRFYRVMQFIGRFDMIPDDTLDVICKSMDLSGLARERIWEEIKKLFLKSSYPSLGFRWLQKIGRLNEIFPELHALIGLQQPQEYHPEGDVFEHTMQSLDAAAQQKLYRDDHEKMIIMLAVLCHDLGKATTTTSDARALGHEDASVDLGKKLLCRLTDQQDVCKTVGKLVRYHMLPGQFIAENASLKAYKRLAIKLAPETSLYQLMLVCLADRQGRNGSSSKPLPCDQSFYDAFFHQASQASVIHNAEPPVLQGRDLLDVFTPGPQMGKALALAYQLQIEEEITDSQELKRRVLEMLIQK